MSLKYKLTEDEMTAVLSTTKFYWIITTLEELEKMGKLSHEDVKTLMKPMKSKFMEHLPEFKAINKRIHLDPFKEFKYPW